MVQGSRVGSLYLFIVLCFFPQLFFYSKELRNTFQSAEHPSKRLKAKDKEEPIDERLMKAMAAYKKRVSNRGPINSIITHLEAVNQHELCGILQYFLQISPNSSPEQFRYAITVLDFMARLEIKTEYPYEFDVVAGHVDQVLLVAWTKQQGKNSNRRAFLEVYEKHWPLVLPEDSVRAVLEHEGDWCCVEAHLRAVTCSSALGREMFGVCCYQAMAEKADQIIGAHVEKMFAQSETITKTIFDAAKKAALQEVLSGGQLDGCPDRRMVMLKYRGTNFHILVSCVGEEVEMKFHTALKAHASAHGMIPPLFCESDLVDKAIDMETKISDELLKGVRLARQAANEGLQGEQGQDGATVAAYLTKRAKNLVTLDPMWKIDTQWMISMVGEAGEKRLEQKCMEVLPSETKKLTLTHSIQKLQALRESKLFSFCSEGARGAVMGLLDCLGLMVAGKAPNIKSSPTDFMKKALIRLQYFCRYGPEPSMTGGKAASAHLQDLVGKGSAKCSIADVEPIVVFAWLLEHEQQTQAADLVKDVLAASRAFSASQSSEYPLMARSQASSSSAQKRKLGKSPEGGKSEVQSALDMFG
jgi:hypothetical protein